MYADEGEEACFALFKCTYSKEGTRSALESRYMWKWLIENDLDHASLVKEPHLPCDDLQQGSLRIYFSQGQSQFLRGHTKHVIRFFFFFAFLLRFVMAKADT